MTTGLKDLEDNKQDDRHNPAINPAGSLSRREDDAFKGITDNYGNTANDGQENANITKAKDQEEGGGWNDNTTPGGRFGGLPAGGMHVWTKGNVKALLRKKGPLGLIITIFLGGGVGLGGLFGGALAPIAFFANITNDLNDQLAAMDVRSSALMRNRIPKDAKEAIAGCTKLSIKCKFKTMSETQKTRLEKAGIKVTAPESTKILGKTRYVATEYTFRGKTMDAPTFAREMRTNGALKTAYKRANNMKFLGLNDVTFTGRVLAKFGVSKKAPELSGSHQDKVNALMNKAAVTDVKDLKFTSVIGDNGSESWTLDGDTSDPKTKYSADQVTKMKASITKISAPPSRAKANAIKGLSVIGAVDLACTVKNMIGMASVAAKVANQAELVKYAMPVAASVGKIQAGDATPEDAQVVGEFFTSTDNRQKIIDLSKSIEEVDGPDGTKIGPIQGNLPEIYNPNYGKNTMDSPLYQMSTTGQYTSTSSIETQYSLGVGQRTAIRSLADIGSYVNSISGSTCQAVQNWFVRGVGLVAGVALAIGSSGTSLAIQGAAAVGLFAATMTLQGIISSAASGSVIGDNMSEAPVDRGAAAWTGMAGTLSTSAQSRGMIPGNTDQLMAYSSLQTESKNDYIAVAKSEANPLDIKDQYSFLGSIAYSFLPYVTSSTSVASTLGTIVSLPTKSFGAIINSQDAQAASFDKQRYSLCDDETYVDFLKINPDVQCNLRYYMPDADLALDSGEVAQYMEDNGYVEQDTTTGLPAGYTPLKAQESQGFAMDALNGVTSQFIKDRNYGEGAGAEYGKFLDYCVYRVLPYGETFEEDGAINKVNTGKDDWLSGKKCLDTTDEKMSYFRIYTLDKSVSEAEDEDSILAETSNTTGPTEVPGSNQNSGNAANDNGWSWPTTLDVNITTGWMGYEGHNGVDMGMGENKPIYAMRDGVVDIRSFLIVVVGKPGGWCPAFVGEDRFGTMQDDMTVIHTIDGQHYRSTYAHMNTFVKKDGDVVKAGDLLGYSGDRGCSIGPHVHISIQDPSGAYINPEPLMRRK